MKKIPCLYERDFTNQRRPVLLDAVTPGCEWVMKGEGIATRKWDGTAVLVRDGRVFARYDAKPGKTPPAGAIPCSDAMDPITGHWPHWVEATRPEDRWIQEAFMAGLYPDGTYEAVGPKINGNPERLGGHVLMRHGADTVCVERTREGIRRALSERRIEGIVFHGPNGRMCKIRRRDFGLPWPAGER